MPNRPNIILIMSDQHNASAMGCAGNPIVQTPHLDTLAQQGVRFTNTYCPYPLCAPSRAGFMSAQYPSDIGIYDNSGSYFFNPQTPTFTHSFGAAGYETILCGRMHFGPFDAFHGFEKRIHGDTGNMLSREIQGEGLNRTNGQTHYAVEVSGYGKTGGQAFDHSVTKTACDFIANRDPQDRPYVLVVGYFLPHNPLICSKEDFDFYMAQIPPLEPESQDYLDTLHPAMKKWRERRGVDGLTPEQNRRGLAAYYGLVTELDRNIGRVHETIAASSQAENTLLAYTSDHGDMAHQHGMWWKSNFYDGACKIPLIISQPSRLAKNETVSANVSLIDVGPTLLDLAGADPLPDVSGKSFASFLNGENPSHWPNEVFSEYGGLLGDYPACMIRTGPWKLNYYSEFDSCQLFNINEDPHERKDRASDPNCLEIILECLSKIDARWSADEMQENIAKQKRARKMLQSCGHALAPHAPPHFQTPEGSNEFDFSQLPQKPSWSPFEK
ncbi:MAG: choline-sulfatase [Candidatus Latescibacterota bacterium]|jgi:choline-sulfatase